jgi:hypothetical protein
MVTLADQVQVDVAERRQEAIRILTLPGLPVGEAKAQLVVDGQAVARQEHSEYSTRQQRHRPRAAAHDDLAARRVRMVGPHHDAFAAAVLRRVRAQHRVRLVAAILDQTGELLDVPEQHGV